MNNKFTKYQKIISKLCGVANKPGFDGKFATATAHLAKKDSFLLKMEIKRLAGPCTRVIDLRGLVDGECHLFDYKGTSHFLDTIAIKVFQENIALFGSYTFGVYEAVTNTENNFSNLYKKEQANVATTTASSVNVNGIQEKTQYSAKLYPFDNYPDRCEERMNFATPIMISLSDDRQLDATSVDLSVSGAKFRISSKITLGKGQVIGISFSGLEQEFQFEKHSRFSYQIENVYRDAGTQLIGCKRVEALDDGFAEFLHGYIQGNKRRYKINLDNSINSIQARGFEQFALRKLNELPIFVQEEEGEILPKYILTTHNNRKISQYWQNENGATALHYLINTARLQRLKKASSAGKTLLVFSFVHQHKNNSFFYTMDEQQANEDEEFFLQFLVFAANKPSFSITQLSYLEADVSRAYSPFTLSDTQTKQQQYLNPSPSDEVKEQIESLKYIVVANLIEDENVINDYQRLTCENIDKQKLRLFGHKRTGKKINVDAVAINYTNQRQETRFIYKTPTIIECRSKSWSGVSEDFSVSGLKVELKAPATLSAGDIVYLSFPKLQQITSAFDLKQLAYRVIRINKNKTTVNLRVSVKKHQHIGRAFFKLLIEKNRNKLTPDEYAMLTPGLAESLRTIYATSLNKPTLMVQTSGGRHKVEAIAVSELATKHEGTLLSQMKRLSDRQNFYNLYPVLHNLQASTWFENQLKKLLPTDRAVSEFLYISIKPNIEHVERAVSIKLASELNTPELKQFFIKKSLEQGFFYCIQLKLSRSEPAEMEHLNPELSYIGSYAIHRGKQIEQEILTVAGLIQLFDVTDEAVLRYDLIAKYESGIERSAS